MHVANEVRNQARKARGVPVLCCVGSTCGAQSAGSFSYSQMLEKSEMHLFCQNSKESLAKHANSCPPKWDF